MDDGPLTRVVEDKALGEVVGLVVGDLALGSTDGPRDGCDFVDTAKGEEFSYGGQ